MLKNSETTRISKRLMPLYAGAFFQGFIFWYSIEKIFMKSIGFDDASIGLMIAFYSTVMLLAEIPSGILADRWSRKGVLILASLALGLSAVIGGLSTNVVTFMISTGFWGVFFALYSGTYDSIVYDTVYEETSSSGHFERFLGRIKAIDSTALVVSSIIGGLIANFLGLRYAFFLTIPFIGFSVLAILKFKEPKLHKLDVATPMIQHIKDTFSAVLKKGSLRPILLVLITVTASTYLILEFSQLWYIALLVPVVLFGPINALLLSTLGLAGLLVTKINFTRSLVLFMFLGAMLTTAIGLVFSRNTMVTVFCIVLLTFCLISLNIVFTKLLHDSLSSRIRAGAASAVSTMSRIVVIPISIIFGYVSNRTSIFDASWLIVGLVIIAVILVIKTHTKKSFGYSKNSVIAPSPADIIK